MRAFGQAVKEAREKRGMSREKLAEIQSCEPGESTPEQAREIGRRFTDKITKGRYRDGIDGYCRKACA